MIRPTMFDAFINTMSKQHVAKQAARKIVNAANKNANDLETFAQTLIKDAHANVGHSTRIKEVDSTAKKIQRYLTEDFDTYNNKREEVLTMILGEKGVGSIVGDLGGIRFWGKDSELKKIYDTTIKYAKEKKDFAVTSFENYYGKGVNPYATKPTLGEVAKLKYKNIFGNIKNTIVTTAEKKAGYTRDNFNAFFKGLNIEGQVGGQYTTFWGDVEHLLYDLRQGKSIDFSHYTPEQTKIAKEIIKDYKALLQNNKMHKAFMKNYLSKVWGSLRNSELQNLDIPVFPEFLAGYAPSLRAENIMKLAKIN